MMGSTSEISFVLATTADIRVIVCTRTGGRSGVLEFIIIRLLNCTRGKIRTLISWNNDVGFVKSCIKSVCVLHYVVNNDLILKRHASATHVAMIVPFFSDVSLRR